jgi:CO/xanthine dehydrogenase Mo-binding subunit
MGLLAEKLGMDPIALRMTNAIQAGDTTPTQNILDDNTGDLIGFTTKEAFLFDSRERVVNASLRDFKILRFGEHPHYDVDFLTTPQKDGPFGARGLGEQGILGMPGALAAAFSRAVGTQLTQLPITPELLWRKGGAS